MMDMNTYDLRFKVEQEEEWIEWFKKMPSFQFDSDWAVKIIPPFHGAMVRFHIGKGEKQVSVYLDTMNRLGYFGSPYWEIWVSREGAR